MYSYVLKNWVNDTKIKTQGLKTKTSDSKTETLKLSLRTKVTLSLTPCKMQFEHLIKCCQYTGTYLLLKFNSAYYYYTWGSRYQNFEPFWVFCSKRWWMWWWSYLELLRHASHSHRGPVRLGSPYPAYQHSCTGWMCFLWPAQQCHGTEDNMFIIIL